MLQLYSEALQRFRLAAAGHGHFLPPEQHRARIHRYFDPLPIWYESLDDDGARSEHRGPQERYPLSALTQRPMHMYHAWGSQNAWLRQITQVNRLYVHHRVADALGLADEDWAWIESAHGRVKARIKRMDGVNPDTVWTWNAIGKRRGAWALDANAAESREGFLLNHIIRDLLPARADGHRYANADPLTGQAAWFDLRVRIEKCAAHECTHTEPYHEPVPRRSAGFDTPAVLRFGAELRDGDAAQGEARLREFLGPRDSGGGTHE